MKLTEAIGTLHTTIEIGEERLPDLVSQAKPVLDKAVARRSMASDVTIVALAGATGAGKSSLLNALVGREIARVSPIRPTTSDPIAVTNTNDSDVLDWLDIAQRHEVELRTSAPMVLVDLPDIDSTSFAHRDTARRLTSIVDVVVWVLDPQKYADAVVHEDYLAGLAEHAETTIVVLNQADRLDDETRTSVLADAQRLISEDGLDVEVMPTSAITGMGLARLWGIIDGIATEKSAAAKRLSADIRTVGRQIVGGIHAAGGKQPDQAQEPDFAPVSAALASAGGSGVVADAAATSYERRAHQATGWPVTRWLAGRKVDPLKRLRLAGGEGASQTRVTGVRDAVAPALITAARGKLRTYVDQSTQHLPKEWALDARGAASQKADLFLGRVDQIIADVDVEARRRPAWWVLFNAVQWLALIIAIAGGLWLALLGLADVLHLQIGPPPSVGIFSVPSLMLIGGLVAGWLVALCGRALAKRGARRTGERVNKRLRDAIDTAAREDLLADIATERADYQRFYELASSLISS
ncbi:GTPase [Trueperella bialowiezensis]|uniref:GTPase Era n=1 Tax=Trueperella bialowiezensis TaxID=312285 RepID=A0A3S4VEL3_9ACTO|nr:GTPase [Trueperella bialowiezensis]VEI12469.1 GTPase Era [Trueperella bialowiezensis]